MSASPLERSWRSSRPVQLAATLGVFRRGPGDPTYRSDPDGSVIRCVLTPDGAATVRLHARPKDADVTVQAWGAGATWALDHAPEWVGESDDCDGFVVHHPQVAQALRRFPGWRVPRSGLVLDAFVPAVIEQKVTGQEAFRGYCSLVRRYGDPAPGPAGDAGMRVPPSADGWRRIPSWGYLTASVDAARSDTIQRVCRVADTLARVTALPAELARARLQTVPGVGRWTAAEVAHRALGDPDAVSFGDYHVAKNIGWALTGVEIDDDALAELLEPYAGHRYRVQRLLELAGHHRPRRGARMAPRTHLPRRGG
ncbi:MAG TPA: DNA-3-methyladenine glycosylase 2 family protein [Dermatophilaceae bacterium]|nr:DNA-3-methyladenine glycosylase 2 family protein [Dermatophilaceae bacterium]